MEYKNFFENIQEATLRLQGTIVLYDGEPFYVHVICDHKPDGAFRVYMSPLEDMGKGVNIPALHQIPPGHASLGPAMDAYVDGTTPISIKIIRKRMDSKLFNKFRPFPLGMCNYKANAYFLERRPNRPSTKQGLIPQAIEECRITAGISKIKERQIIHLYGTEFRDCVRGDYPSPKECLSGLKADNINESVAFHRNFALVRGPIDTLFLAYKTEVVAALPYSDFSKVRLGKDFKHIKEAVNELRLFTSVE